MRGGERCAVKVRGGIFQGTTAKLEQRETLFRCGDEHHILLRLRELFVGGVNPPKEAHGEGGARGAPAEQEPHKEARPAGRAAAPGRAVVASPK